MAHKVLDNGTAYEINGGKVLDNGTAYEIDHGRVMDEGAVFDISFGPQVMPIFSDNEWGSIIFACQNNAVPETWAIGDSKSLTIDGVSYQIDIIGKNHDSYSDGSGNAPLTFQMHDCFETKYPINNTGTNSGGWEGCVMRNTTLPAILATMPNEVRSAIKEVNKLTSAGFNKSSIVTSADKLFLLSEIEVFGKVTQSFSGEGKQYEYYSAGNSKVKYSNGTTTAWWERSPKAGGISNFCAVGANAVASGTTANYSLSVSFGFCF